jgi:hypothetical protein
MLLESGLLKRLDSPPRVKKVVDNFTRMPREREAAEVKEWLQEELPTLVTGITEID